MKKRALSILLAVLMLTTIVPVEALATETGAGESITAETGEVNVDGVGSVGMLLSSALTEEQQEKSEELEHITDVEFEGSVATVSYQVLDDDCSVVVALYDDLHPETMLTSGTAEVTADKTRVKVTMAGEMPEHFLATAYLIDRQTLAPRCAAFTTQLYTAEMQAFLATTVADYDENLVLNLDDDDTTNFAVFSEDTAQLEGSGSKNQLTDNGNGTYTITNADQTVTSLQEGNVFSYPLENNQMLLVKIKTITVSGTTVTITEDTDVALEDFFDYFKVETDGSDAEMTVDDSTCAEGVAYVEEVTPPVLNGLLDGDLVDAEGSLNLSASFKLDKTLAGGDGAKVKLVGSVGLDFGVSLKCYITMQYQYVSLKLDTKLNFSAGFSGKVTMTEIPLARIEIPVLPCINVGFTPAFVTEVSGKIECKGSVKTTIGFAYDSNVGFINLSSWPKLDAKVEFSGTLFVGFQAEPYVAIISADLCKARVDCSAGVEIEGKQTIGQPSESSCHDCNGCIAGTVSTRLEVSAGVDIVKGWLKAEAKIAATKKKYGDFYCSLEHLEFGWGTCPHIRYKTTVTVKKESGAPAPHVVINGTKLPTAPVTNAGGQAVFYLPNGTYTLFVTNGGQTTRKTLTIHDSGKALTITYGEADSGGSGWGGGGGGGVPIMSSIVDFGDCGEDVKWKLDGSGLLYIYGEGAMMFCGSYNGMPWYENRNDIKKVVIGSDITFISNWAFADCANLTSVTIPDGVIGIGMSAFRYCTSLTSVAIPNSVTIIDTKAFIGCTNLQSMTIPDGVTTIYAETFNGCTSLQSVTIPDSVTTIEWSAFYDCVNLTSVTIPDSVTTIGIRAFEGCSGLQFVTIPDSVTSIGEYAFHYCVSLASVTIPDSVTDMGRYAFCNCNNLTDFTVDSNNPSFCNDSNGVLFNKSKTELIQYPMGNQRESYTIPDGVTTIGDWAFGWCENLTSVTIPDSVTSIGKYAFRYCESLTAVTIPEGVTSIGDWAFEHCGRLTTVTIPEGVTGIGVEVFSNCNSLTSLTIPDSVTSIANGAFFNCGSLTTVTISNSVTTIGSSAFWWCDSLTDVYYTGTQAQWENISIYSNNDPLAYATIHYNATAPAMNAAPVVSAAAERPAAPTELPVPELPVPPMPQRETLFEELSAPTPLGAMLPSAENTVEDRTVTSRFTGLISGMDYVLLVVKDPAAEELLAPENLLYIAQSTATEEGTVSFTYCLSTGDTAWPYAGGLTPADCNGDGTVDVLDMACLYTWLSTGEKEGKLSDAAFTAVCDTNGDGEVNILDYQKLYEIVKNR